jgi:outer membrane lipoprotein carrier protein
MTVADPVSGKVVLNAGGEVWLANKRRYRVQYQQPQKQLLVSNGRRRWLYLQAINQVQLQALPPEGNPTEFFLELGGGLARLVKHARVTHRKEGMLDVYTLVPGAGSLYQKAVLWTKGKNKLPVKLVVLAERRVQVTFRIKQVKLTEQKLTPAETGLFNFQIPKDAEVIEMLGNMP